MIKQQMKATVYAEVDYDYDIVRDCPNNYCDGICRCGRYTNTEVTKVLDVQVSVNIKDSSKRKPTAAKLSDIDNYCIDRMVVYGGAYNVDNYSFNISNGYYGEEIDSITLDDVLELEENIVKMLELPSDYDKIIYVLGLEYPYIADIILNKTTVMIENVDIRLITPSNGHLVSKAATEYWYDVCRDAGLPKGIVIDSAGSTLLVDGNHRLLSLLEKLKDDPTLISQYKYIKLS